MDGYKDDWSLAAQRLEAWWQREIIDRPCLQIVVPRDPTALGLAPDWPEALQRGSQAEQEAQSTALKRWLHVGALNSLDPQRAVDRQRRAFGLTHFVGESYPRMRVYLGPGVLSAVLGCPLKLEEFTSWQDPILTDWRQADQLQWDEQNRWWQLVLRLTETAVADSGGDYVVGITDLGGAGDLLANLRGTGPLLTDLYDHPEAVLALEGRICDWWLAAYERLYRLTAPLEVGSSSWLLAWHHGRTYPVQCDFSAMISPKMFERFFLPTVLRQAAALDRCIYHLDGPDAVRHLDLLLGCPEIQAIQWVPGAGAGPMVQWVPLLRRIQAGKKALHITAGAWEVAELLENLRPEGLMIETVAADLGQANALLRLAEQAAARQAQQFGGV
ncbi:MAG: hypothetical protein GX605_07540 [Chloroflexi bacterium]|nr:hypothetical protein [Chloroflexota bacterium]